LREPVALAGATPNQALSGRAKEGRSEDDPFKEELAPSGTHDDQIDAFALNAM
jgi:hypothetical protein